MRKRQAVEPFPQFASWVSDHCSKSEIPVVRDSREAVRLFLVFDQRTGQKYGWRFSTVEVIGELAKKATTIEEINKIYWMDTTRNIEAYCAMTYWRASEILRPAIRSLNTREYIASAVLARSLLELASTYLLNAKIISECMERLDFTGKITGVIQSEELEKFLLKAIWGTRLGKPEDYRLQRNVLTTIQKISKNPTAADLLPTYEYLCEIAHPNVVGNTRFWSHVEKIYDDGAELRVISRDPLAPEPIQTIDKTIWAIAWGAAVTFNAFQMTSDGVRGVLKKLERRWE